MKRALFLFLLWLVLPGSNLYSQVISGQIFEDWNGNGVWDPGEPQLDGIEVGLLGTASSIGPVDTSVLTDTVGFFSFAPGEGCYVIDLPDPVGMRLTLPRSDGFPEPTAPFAFPVGQPRFGKLDLGPDHLRSGGITFVPLGDSIAWNFNICGYPESFWYSKQVTSRMACVAPSVAVALSEGAVKGEHTDDLLVHYTDDGSSDLNNVFRMVELQPQLVTLSLVGNDLLDVDVSGIPSQSEVNRAVAEILDSRRNLQEVLSVLVSEVPDADIALNTLYDNLAYNCASTSTSPFHQEWIPIIAQILRDLAWGQARRVGTIEASAEFGQEGQDGSCSGYDQLICRDLFQLDQIHPNNDGYQVMREKLWEGVGGVMLGPGDVLGRANVSGVDYGFLRRVARVYPNSWALLAGAQVTGPTAAFSDQDGEAAASIGLGVNEGEFRVSGFPFWLDEIQIVKVVAGVRYRTSSGTVDDDLYRIEASVTGVFEAPGGYSYTPTNWNFSIPLVGGGGPNQPTENADYPDARMLAVPNVPALRVVSSTLTKNPDLPPGAADYQWPAITHADLSTAALRVVATPGPSGPRDDVYRVELESAWLDLYGWEKARPAPAGNLDVNRLENGDLEITFDAVPLADRYNLYVGSADTLSAGYDHGDLSPWGPYCNVVTADIGGGRLKITLLESQLRAEPDYFLVTAHQADVESPAGFDSFEVERDRSQSSCL